MPIIIKTIEEALKRLKTLQENNMIEIKKVFDVSSFLIINRNALKINSNSINQIIKIFDV